MWQIRWMTRCEWFVGHSHEVHLSVELQIILWFSIVQSLAQPLWSTNDPGMKFTWHLCAKMWWIPSENHIVITKMSSFSVNKMSQNSVAFPMNHVMSRKHVPHLHLTKVFTRGILDSLELLSGLARTTLVEHACGVPFSGDKCSLKPKQTT